MFAIVSFLGGFLRLKIEGYNTRKEVANKMKNHPELPYMWESTWEEDGEFVKMVQLNNCPN